MNIRKDLADPSERCMLVDFAYTDSTEDYHVTDAIDTTRWSGQILLVGDVTVPAGAKLFLEPRTRVRVRANYDSQGSGSDASRTEIRVVNGGELFTWGTDGSLPQNFKRFLSASKDTTKPGDWFGINVIGGALDLVECDIAHGRYGINAAPSPSTFSIRDCVIHDNAYHGVKAQASQGRFEIHDSVIHSNELSGVLLMKSRTLFWNPLLVAKITGNEVYSNAFGNAGGYQVELRDFGGTGAMRDTVEGTTVGGMGRPPDEYGIYADREPYGSGAHSTFMYEDSVANFTQDAVTFSCVSLARLTNSTVARSYRGLVVEGAAVSVDSCIFDADTIHVWSEGGSTTCLGDTASPGCPGYNVFGAILSGSGYKVCNLDTISLLAQTNYWMQDSCETTAPPSSWFTEHVTYDPWICFVPGGAGQGARPLPLLREDGSSGADVGPLTFSLSVCAPNPFSPKTEISYTVADAMGRSAPVSLRVYDVSGRLVRTLVSGPCPPGRHTVHWDGTGDSGLGMPAGVYFASMEAGTYHGCRKLVLAR